MENGNPIYDSRNDCNAIIRTADNELVVGCNSTVIPESVTSIGSYAFSGCSGLTSDIIPNNVTYIREGAFSGCSGLTSITIPRSMTIIEDLTFSGCSSLTSISIPNSATSIGRGAFHGCSSLTSVTIPNSVTSIGSNAFHNCSSLTSIAIPNSVTSIGSNAFRNCLGLTTIIIGNSVTSIEFRAFYGCSSLTSVTSLIEEPFAIGGIFEGCDNITLYVPAGTKSKYEATDGWKNFTNIVEVDLNSIIDFADATVKAICVEHWDTNGDGMLSYDEAAAVVNLQKAFGGSDITSFNELQYFTGLKRIRFLDFLSCKLTSVIIPNSVKSIEDAAFERCSRLTTITIPNSVTSIKGKVFYGCTSLTSVISYIKEPFAIDDEVFYTIYDEKTDTYYFTTATLYVPTGTKAKYETTDGWKNFKNIVEMELQPVDNGQTIDFSTDIDENTNLNGSIMDNVFVNVNNGDGSYDPSEGCIIVSKPTDDSAIDGKEIFGEDFKDNYTGIVFKLASGEGTIKVEAQTTGNMVLKVKIGDGMPITMELEGKLKVSFPYTVSEDTYVYIYGGLNTSNNAKGMRRAESADGTLKIYGIEVDSNANGIESLEVSQDDIATIYNLNGHRINSLQRGINIIRMNDGTVRKVVVK